MNELVLEDMHGKEDSIEHNIKSSEGESETMMSSKDTKELSGPFRESDPGSVEHLEGGSEKLIEYDTGISPSNVNSDVPETMIRSEEVMPCLTLAKDPHTCYSTDTELQQQ